MTCVNTFFVVVQAMKRIAGGVGMMSNENYTSLLKKDYDALQSILGEQKFLFGDDITSVRTFCSTQWEFSRNVNFRLTAPFLDSWPPQFTSQRVVVPRIS